MPTSKSGFSVIILLLVISLLLVAVIIFVPQKVYSPSLSKIDIEAATPPANKSHTKDKPEIEDVYSDSDHNFQFRYKTSSYEIINYDEEQYSKLAATDFRKNFLNTTGYPPPTLLKGLMVKRIGQEIASQFNMEPLIIWVFDNPNQLDATQWYQRYWHYPFVWGDYSELYQNNFGPKDETTISGRLASSAVIPYRPGNPQFTYLPFENKMFLFILPTEGDQNDAGKQILSSFQFENQISDQ